MAMLYFSCDFCDNYARLIGYVGCRLSTRIYDLSNRLDNFIFPSGQQFATTCMLLLLSDWNYDSSICFSIWPNKNRTLLRKASMESSTFTTD